MLLSYLFPDVSDWTSWAQDEMFRRDIWGR